MASILGAGLPLRLGRAARPLLPHGGWAPPNPCQVATLPRCAYRRSPASRFSRKRRAASAGCGGRPVWGVPAPPHPAPSPCSPSAAPRLPYAARGAYAPVRPQGLPGGKKPQLGQAESQCSSGVGLCGQGQALRCAPGGVSASLDRAHPAAGQVPAAWPAKRAGASGSAGTRGAPVGRGAAPCRAAARPPRA